MVHFDRAFIDRRFFYCSSSVLNIVMSVCLFGVVQFLNVLILTLLCVQFIYSAMVTGLPPVWERAANSAYHLRFCCLLGYICLSFPLMFGIGFGF